MNARSQRRMVLSHLARIARFNEKNLMATDYPRLAECCRYFLAVLEPREVVFPAGVNRNFVVTKYRKKQP